MASLSGYPADTPQLSQACTAGTQHAYAVKRGAYDFNAWGVAYDLDETRSPAGTARFTCPADRASSIDPIRPRRIEIYAGYGTTQNVVFSGLPVRRTLRRTSAGDVVDVALSTGEDVYDLVSRSELYQVPASYTGLNQVIGNTWTAQPWYWPNLSAWNHYTDPALPAPSAAQLAAFRALQCAAGDSASDYLRNAASALGHRIHGDHLIRAGGTYAPDSLTWAIRPQWSYDAGAAPTLTAAEWSDYQQTVDASNWANAITLTANWAEGNSRKSSVRTYGSVAVGDRLSVRTVSVEMIPATVDPTYGRVLGGSEPIAYAYLAGFNRARWKTTITARAWWWLEPGASLNITGPDGTTQAGIVTAIATDVDAGTMTVTLRPA